MGKSMGKWLENWLILVVSPGVAMIFGQKLMSYPVLPKHGMNFKFSWATLHLAPRFVRHRMPPQVREACVERFLGITYDIMVWKTSENSTLGTAWNYIYILYIIYNFHSIYYIL